MARSPSTATPVVEVRALRESDLVAATHVMQRAFGTFLGAPDPDRFMADRNYVRSRWRADPTSALVAVVDGKVVGSNLVTSWGSVGFFGPLTVTPELWNRGVASRLLEPTAGSVHRPERHPHRFVYFRPQSETRCVVSEVRLLAPLPDRHHVQAGG